MDSGKRSSISTHDLVGYDIACLLISDIHGKDWISTAQACARTYNIPIRTVEIGQANNFVAPARDNEEQWQRVNALKRGGAILVRPDKLIAWRSRVASKNGGAELAKAMQCLCKGLGHETYT